jgi:hypothetical protein
MIIERGRRKMIVQSCGKCAIEEKLPLEERKELASKIIANQVYKCPACEIHFGLFNNQYASSQDRMELPQLYVEKKALETKIEKPKAEKSITVVQTSLF